MRIAVYVSLIILSLTIFVIGAFIKNIVLVVIGGAIGVSVLLYLQSETEKGEEEKIYLPKDKYEPVISEELKWRWKHEKKK